MTRRYVLWASTDLHTRGGISTYVRALRTSTLWSEWDIVHVPTHRDGSTLAKAAVFARALLVFARRLLTDRPALVHLHMSSHGSFVRKATLFWMARAAHVPVIVHVHTSRLDAFHDAAPAPLQALLRTTLASAATVLALGDRWRTVLLRIAPDARIAVLPNAVETGPLPTRPPGPLRVVFLGQISENKGAFALLEAWAKLGPTRGDARLTVAGDRGTEAARERVRQLGVDDSCEILDWLAPDAAKALLTGSDVLALPSRNEGQPMAVLEAMAAGVCVISTPVGGIPEMITDDREGLLVPPDDIAALTSALGAVLADDGLRARLGRSAHERAEAEFSVAVAAARLDEHYRAVLDGAR